MQPRSQILGEIDVQSEIKGTGDPIHVDYRLALNPLGSKFVDVGFIGASLTETSRGRFQSQIDAGGVDGLIATLASKSNANGNRR